MLVESEPGAMATSLYSGPIGTKTVRRRAQLYGHDGDVQPESACCRSRTFARASVAMKCVNSSEDGASDTDLLLAISECHSIVGAVLRSEVSDQTRQFQ